MRLPALIALVALLLPLPSLAEVHVRDSGSASHEVRNDHVFRLAEGGEVEVTLSCSRNARGAGHLRVYFYERSPQGGWRQIRELRMAFRDNQPEITGKFTLPAGEYAVTVSARRMDYSFVLADAEHD
jgi:hypothetical protein